MEEVAQHSTRDDCWIAVEGGVYDVTDFMEVHPGGIGMLKMVAGKDATQHFQEMHRPEILTTIGAAYRIGALEGSVPNEAQSAGAEPSVTPSLDMEDAEATAVYTLDEVAQHSTRDDCWIVVEGGVYDVTDFMAIHPGGIGMLKMVAGKDATQHFQEMHRPEILTTIGAAYRIGTLASAGTSVQPIVPAQTDAYAESSSRTGDGVASVYTMEEVARHSSKEDCWVVVQGGVYDVADFLATHPGGSAILAAQGGKDATDFFTELHRPQVLEAVAAQYKIGIVSDGTASDGSGSVDGAVGGASGGGEGGAGGGSHAIAHTDGSGHGDQIYTMAEVKAAATASSSSASSRIATDNSDQPRVGLQAGPGVLVIRGGVYDFTPFLEQHPGGKRAILRLSGTDATNIFTECHTPEIYRVRAPTSDRWTYPHSPPRALDIHRPQQSVRISCVQELVPAYRVGTLVSDDHSQMAASSSHSPHVNDTTDGCHNDTIDPLGGVGSPFPSERFDGTGLEVRQRALIWLTKLVSSQPGFFF
jgi:cytochrome b involved in lipid metabolism